MMYKQFFSTAICMVLTISAFSQQQGPADVENSKQRQEQIASELGLSDSQKSQYMQANESHKKDIQAVRSDNSLNGDQKQAEVRKLRQAHEQKIKGMLTPEQYAKWTEMRNKGGQGQGQGRGQGQGQGQGQGRGKGKSKG